MNNSGRFRTFFPITGILLCSVITIVYPYTADAYSASCSFNQDFGTPERILSLAKENSLSGGQTIANLLQNPPAGCSPSDIQDLITAVQNANQQLQQAKDVISNPATPYDQKVAAAKTVTTNTGNVSCAGTWDRIFNPFTCFVRALFAGVGSLFMWIGIKLASAAGAIFEYALKYLIVGFGSLLQAIKPGIDTGWTALRDIANIVIIGIFVFVSINIILGVKDFGDKKRVAHILIVAVLINFSLLFTKVIVDASNFTAYQFYNSMVKGRVSQTNQTIGQTTFAVSGQTDTTAALQGSGVAAEFMKFLGVQGIADSYNTLRQAQEQTQYATAALAYGFLALIFLLAVTFVFLYGAFLIVSRAVLIIFLMLISPLAFAAWLIPPSYIENSFRKWWESLMKTAFFAPILMGLLWITMNVSGAFVTALEKLSGQKGSLGALAANASSEGNALAVLSFIVVLGLLYASFLVASTFSKAIPGFKFSAGMVMTPLAGVSRLAGFAGRGFVGAPLGYYARKMQDSEKWSPTVPGFRGALNRALWRPLAGTAKTSFDVMNTTAARKMAEGLGGYTFGKEVGAGGHWGAMERLATRMEKDARAMAPSSKARGEMAEAAGEKARSAKQTEISGQREDLVRQGDAAAGAVETAKARKTAIESEHETSRGAERQAAEKEKRDAEREKAGAETILKELSKQLARTTDATKQAGIRRQMANHDSNIETQDARIKTANQTIGTLQEDLKRKLAEGGGDVGKAEQAFNKLTRDLEKLDDDTPKMLQGTYENARKARDLTLQAQVIDTAMAKGVTMIGRKTEVLRQLGGARKRTARREVFEAIGEKELKEFGGIKAAETPASAPPPAPPPASSGETRS